MPKTVAIENLPLPFWIDYHYWLPPAWIVLANLTNLLNHLIHHKGKTRMNKILQSCLMWEAAQVPFTCNKIGTLQQVKSFQQSLWLFWNIKWYL